MKKLHIPERHRKWLIVPPLIIGAGIVAFFVSNRTGPHRSPLEEQSRVLHVIKVPEVEVIPRVLGYGTAEPGREWRAVAEVKGRVVDVHPDLEAGALLQDGAEILRIDPAEYRLTAARLEADVAQVTAQLAELDVKEANLRASLKIEAESLALAQRALARSRSAAERRAVAAAQVDKDERSWLAQRQIAQALENSLKLLPAERKTLEASRKVKEAGLAQARLDLDKTTITTPFNCRLGELSIEKGQFVSAGEILFEAHSTDHTEVEAQVPMHLARNLLSTEVRRQLVTTLNLETVRKLFDVEAIVRFRSGEFTAEWDATFSRIRELIHPQTRTLGIVVSVDTPYEKVIPGTRPPLVKGMFCEVELRGRPRKGLIVIPRSALHEGHVYVVNDEQRLERRKVDVAFAQSSFVCLEDGLRKGELLVVVDPTPAIEVLLVTPEVDETILEALIAEARGEVRLR